MPKDLPTAVICDLDGTLALLNGRNPYDSGKCGKDLLNGDVHEILVRLGLPVIFMSGREERFRPQTVKWLNVFAGAELAKAALYMRPTRDKRKDSIVKQELYEAHVKGKFRVLAVFDDRNQVVEMWRSIGLTCCQVAPGDF